MSSESHDPFSDPNLETIVFSSDLKLAKLTTEMVKKVLADITYENGDREWVISFTESNDMFFIRANFYRYDSISKKKGWSKDVRPWPVENWRDIGYLVQTVFKAVMTNEEHEIREGFKYKGKALYGPHSVQSEASRMSDPSNRMRV